MDKSQHDDRVQIAELRYGEHGIELNADYIPPCVSLGSFRSLWLESRDIHDKLVDLTRSIRGLIGRYHKQVAAGPRAQRHMNGSTQALEIGRLFLGRWFDARCYLESKLSSTRQAANE